MYSEKPKTPDKIKSPEVVDLTHSATNSPATANPALDKEKYPAVDYHRLDTPDDVLDIRGLAERSRTVPTLPVDLPEGDELSTSQQELISEVSRSVSHLPQPPTPRQKLTDKLRSFGRKKSTNTKPPVSEKAVRAYAAPAPHPITMRSAPGTPKPSAKEEIRYNPYNVPAKDSEIEAPSRPASRLSKTRQSLSRITSVASLKSTGSNGTHPQPPLNPLDSVPIGHIPTEPTPPDAVPTSQPSEMNIDITTFSTAPVYVQPPPPEDVPCPVFAPTPNNPLTSQGEQNIAAFNRAMTRSPTPSTSRDVEFHSVDPIHQTHLDSGHQLTETLIMANNLHQSRMLDEFIDTIDQNNPIDPPEDDISDFSDEEIHTTEHIEDTDKTPRRNLRLRGYKDHADTTNTHAQTRPAKSYNKYIRPSMIDIPEESERNADRTASTLYDTARSVNNLSHNLRVLSNRQEYGLTQQIVQVVRHNKEINNVERLVQTSRDEHTAFRNAVGEKFASLDSKLDSIIHFLSDLGEAVLENPPSRVPQQQPAASSSHGPDINAATVTYTAQLDKEIARMTSNLVSVNSQIEVLQKQASKNPPSRQQSVPAQPATTKQSNKPAPASSRPPSRPQTPRHPSVSLPDPSNPPSTHVQWIGQPRNFWSAEISARYPLQGQPQHFMSQGFMWFWKQIDLMPDEQLCWWTKVINIGRWGPIDPITNVAFQAHPHPSNPRQNKNRPTRFAISTEVRRHFIRLSLVRAFSHGSYACFPIPPTKPIRDIIKSNNYEWVVYDGLNKYLLNYHTDPLLAGVWFPPGTNIVPRNPNPPHDAPAPEPARVNTSHPSNNVIDAPRPPTQNEKSSQGPPPPADFGEYLEDYSADSPWNKAPGSGNRSFAQIASQNAPRSQPQRQKYPTTNRPRKQDDKWVLSFHGSRASLVTDDKVDKKDKPSESERLPGHIAAERINLSCTAYNIKAILASWSQKGNLVLTFSDTSTDKNITNAAETIKKQVAPGWNTALTKITNQSRIILPNVPCQKVSRGVITGDEMDIERSEKDIWSSEDLESELRKSHPLLKDVKFCVPPAWATRDIPSTSTTATASIIIKDPDSSIMSALTSSSLIMFATRISPKAWKEKINLTQCTRCWRFGKEHPACALVCKLCGSKNHTTDMHNESCKKCKDTGVALDDLRDPNWTCLHVVCANCGRNHLPDNTDCEARRLSIQEARSKNSTLPGQTLISSSFRPSPSRQNINARAGPSKGGPRRARF